MRGGGGRWGGCSRGGVGGGGGRKRQGREGCVGSCKSTIFFGLFSLWEMVRRKGRCVSHCESLAH